MRLSDLCFYLVLLYIEEYTHDWCKEGAKQLKNAVL